MSKHHTSLTVMSQRVISYLAQRLVDGIPGEHVMEELRNWRVHPHGEGYTTATLSSIASLVRTAAVEQRAKQREHVDMPNLSAFKLRDEEVIALTRARQQAQLRKNESLLVVPDTRRLLDTMATMLASSDCSTSSIGKLALPLLIFSGRRMTEVLSFRSSFLPAAHPMYCCFSGALKKRGDTSTYTIPLLCEYAVFRRGLDALRHAQMKDTRNTHGPAAFLTNQQVKRRYGTALVREMRRVDRGLPERCRVHDLRAIYAHIVYVVFRCSESLPRTFMRILCHSQLDEMLNYSSVHLEGVDELLRGSFGAAQYGLFSQ